MMTIVFLTLLFNSLQGTAFPGGGSATDSLTVRNAHAMTYDPDHGVVLLFGGADERQVLADLWAWNGEEWHCLAEAGPRPRTFAALAYDRAGQRLILFGGNLVLFGTAEDTNTFLDDMWAWDGEAWHQIHTKTPSARAETAIAYDSERKRMVLFGGYRTVNNERTRLGDTMANGSSETRGSGMGVRGRRERKKRHVSVWIMGINCSQVLDKSGIDGSMAGFQPGWYH